MSLFRKFTFLSFFLFVFFSTFVTNASAHVKWFVDSPGKYIPGYGLTELPVLALLAVVIGAVVVAFILDRLLKIPENLRLLFTKFENIVTTLFSILVGLALIIFSFQGYLFAPNLDTTTSFDLLLRLVQGLIGLAFLLGIFTRIAATLLVLLYLGIFLRFGLINSLETLEVLGISLFLFVYGRPKWKLFDTNPPTFSDQLKRSSVASLRIISGLNFLILGFSEKILNPSLGQAFLDSHPWNFMKLLGFDWFSDRTFVLFAGGFESLFGLLLVLGLVTRLVSLALVGFFMTTLVLLGPVELIGHLPHFAIVFVLLVFGSGEKFRVGNLFSKQTN